MERSNGHEQLSQKDAQALGLVAQALIYVANCNECDFVANGPSMSDMYRAAEAHSLATDHIEVYVYSYSHP